MGEQTKIAWCDSTANFWRGCRKVSPGCANCYITTTTPFRVSGQKHGDPRVLQESAFAEALRFNRNPWVCDECGASFGKVVQHTCCFTGAKVHRRRIFSLSLGDWLDPEVPVAWLARMLDTIRVCTDVRWLLLTKRPELFEERLRDAFAFSVANYVERGSAACDWLTAWHHGKAPSNVLIGTSVENQQAADERIPALLRIPAAGRFLSLEPLLGPVSLYHLLGGGNAGAQWWIIGGESGPKARPCNVEWIRSLVTQGQAAGVAVFVKQMGRYCIDRNDRGYEGDSGPSGWPMNTATLDCVYPGTYQGKEVRVQLRNTKGGDPSEWPEDVRVREFPEVLR